MADNIDPAVLEQIGREVKNIGGNVDKLKADVQKELAEVRAVAEGAKSTLDPLVDSKVKAFSASITEKYDALKAQIDEVELAAKRAAVLGGGKDEVKAEDIRRHFLAMASLNGPVKADAKIEINADAFNAWAAAFPAYLRGGMNAMQAPERQAAWTAGNLSGNTWVVPATLDARIRSIVRETTPIFQLANVVSITTDSLEMPYDDAEAEFGWVGESEPRDDETGAGEPGTMVVPVNEAWAQPAATVKMIEDGGIDVESWFLTKVADRIGRGFAAASVNGNGVKKPRGFLTYAAGTWTDGNGKRGTIERIVSGDAGKVTSDGLIKLSVSLKEPYLPNAVFLMRRTTVGDVLLLKDQNDQYMWRPGLSSDKPETLLGYPVRNAADMPAVAAGSLPIAFGDFREGYTIVERLGMTVIRDEVTKKGRVKFYCRRRAGGDVSNFEAIKTQQIAAS